jgi:hypothetical protein
MEDAGNQLAFKQYGGQGVTSIVRQTTGDQLLISACGRTCSIDMHHSRSIVDLQAALQRTLQMEGQAFHICDINGALLSTDMQVQDAITQGLTPLCATLPDKSLHHLENRREELAQMQWKLVRDQMTQSNNQVTQLTRQINELQFQVSAISRECQGSIEQFRTDTVRAMEVERITTKAELQPVQEAVNGAVLLINGERSKRELSVQGFEKHIHGVCDMLDGERASRRQDLAMHMSVMQELRASLDSERNARIELQEIVTDLKRTTTKGQEDGVMTAREQGEKIQRMQTDASTSLSDMMARFVDLEDRSAALENSLTETTTWTTGSLDKIGERHERVSQACEALRLHNKNQEGGIAACVERIREIETSVKQYDIDTRDILGKEKQAREDQIRRTSQVFTNESLKQITELEKRLTIRLERESAEREKNFQSMIDEVSNIVDDRRLFRDQTITKTISTQPVGTGSSARMSGMSGEFEPVVTSPRLSYQPSDATIPDGVQEKAYPIGSEGGRLIGTTGYGTQPTMAYTGNAQGLNTPSSRSGTPLRTIATGSFAPGSITTAPLAPTPAGGPMPWRAPLQPSPGSQTMSMVGSQPGSQQGSFRAPLGSAPLAVPLSARSCGPGAFPAALPTRSTPAAAYNNPMLSPRVVPVNRA